VTNKVVDGSTKKKDPTSSSPSLKNVKKTEKEQKKKKANDSKVATAKKGKRKSLEYGEIEKISREQLRDMLTVPKSSLSANNTLKAIMHDISLVGEWLHMVSPKKLFKLFKSAGSLSQDQLCAIIRALSKYVATKDPERALQALKYLAKTGRFGLNIAMVDEETEEAIQQVFDFLEKQDNLDSVQVQSIKDLYV